MHTIGRSSNGYLVRTSRDPFREFDSLVRTAFGAPTTRTGQPAGFSPAVESHREGDDAVIRFELPGVDVANDVTVELKGRVLVVAGERRDQREDTEGRRFSEFRYGSFRRTFRLAPHLTAEALTATYDAGVLSVRVAGAYAEAEGQRVEITSTVPVTGEVTEAVE